MTTNSTLLLRTRSVRNTSPKSSGGTPIPRWAEHKEQSRILTRRLPQGAVPIVMGGVSEGDYSRLAPPNSYLHVDQFKGPEDLADKVFLFQNKFPV